MSFGWRPYVSVATRRAHAQRKMSDLQKKGVKVQPVVIEGRKIARTFWGESWCDHLESFSDYANRLPRGRTYVRNGSVCHLEIARGSVKAKVSGSELYDVTVKIKELPSEKWSKVKGRCTGQISSLLELLRGQFSKGVMAVVTDKEEGLFPLPSEIDLDCSCPDWATMCKHVAAVLYGVGARLDHEPELLFQLRGVDSTELVETNVAALSINDNAGKGSKRRLASGSLSDMFGIEIADEQAETESLKPKGARRGGGKVEQSGSKAELRRSIEPENLRGASIQHSDATETGVRTGAGNVGVKSRVVASSAKAGGDAVVKSRVVASRAKAGGDAVMSHAVESGAKAGGNAVVKSRAVESGVKVGGNVVVSSRAIKSGVKTGAKLGGSAKSSTVPARTVAPTGKTVRDLRAGLELSQSGFAQLVGVSAATVSLWEKKRGRLSIKPENLAALLSTEKLSKKQAQRKLASLGV